MNVSPENVRLAFSLGAIATVVFILVLYFMDKERKKK